MILNIFVDHNGNFMWSSFAALASFVAAGLAYRSSSKNSKIQKEIAQQQIDANLKANARIRWITEVRQKSSELISVLLSLQKRETVYYEQWTKIEEITELLKLYFNSKTDITETEKKTTKNKKISEEIYIYKSKIELSNSAKNILLDKANENDSKNPYIRRYIECLTELYKDDNYNNIINEKKYYTGLLNKIYEDNFYYSLSKGEAEPDKLTNTPIEHLEGEEHDYVAKNSFIPKYKSKLDKIDDSLINYQEAIDFFSKIIALYLKIEWDRAKKGK